MRFAGIQKVIGFLLIASSLMMVPPVLVSLYYHDGTYKLFLDSAGIFLLLGLLVYLPVRHEKRELRLRDGFLVVTCSWLAVILVGALPFVLLSSPDISFLDAVFESASGFTTTGATIISNVDALPRAILFYRMETQWLGGMGIIVLAVAILPMLRIGGMQLYRAEIPGPVKDSKLTPRITETAKALWLIYLGITGLCIAAYEAGGMDLFDAVGHGFSTVATGGFSTHNESFAYWNNPELEAIALFFMFMAGINFSLHFLAWKKASLQYYFRDNELKVYALLLFAFIVMATFALYLTNTFDSLAASLRHGAFHVVSVMSTTGFTTDPFYTWPSFVPLLLIFVAFIGGCAGSTAGGMKVIRIILLHRQALRELRMLIHPNAALPIKYGKQTVTPQLMAAIWGFFLLFIASFAVMTMMLTATGLDMVTSYSAVVACIANMGPALGEAGVNYATLNDPAKLILSFAMLLGRLEIYTVLILLMPEFWNF
ncbi:MAG: TrkH family potassium uptake protein [Xanthomonadales bacterium]|nr:TrkH family potassium uptake protein [Xanthomonadales bacterium]